MKWNGDIAAKVYAKSPLAEGRELKYAGCVRKGETQWSPLAEGRELKCVPTNATKRIARRPSRRGVN